MLRPKKGCFLLIFALTNAAALFSLNMTVGYIEYSDSDFSLTRAGRVIRDVSIGDEVENFDLIKTDKGSVVIKLYASTGMDGVLTIKPKSVFAIKSETIRGVGETEGDLINGRVSVKVQKLAGEPKLRIRTGSTVMGVRGTQFDVAVSVNDSLLVGCSEGRVVCSDDLGDELEAVPGSAVEKKAGERLSRIPVAISDLASFQENWIVDEIEAFNADPIRALSQYAVAYRRHRDQFRKVFTELVSVDALALWKAEYMNGVTPRPNDINVMKQKSAVAPKLMAVRGVLFLFERIYYRLDEIRSLIDDSSLSSRLTTGERVFDFYRELSAEYAELEAKTAAYRFAVLLYAMRNEGREPTDFSSDDGDFFDDIDSFFD